MNEFMQAAIDEAIKTQSEGGYPFGAALVRAGSLLSLGHNRSIQDNDPTSHAEIEAIRNAGLQESYAGTVMYATALPCLMCAGAIVRLGIPRVVVGATWHGDGSLELMRSRGVEVIELELDVCQKLLDDFREMS